MENILKSKCAALMAVSAILLAGCCSMQSRSGEAEVAGFKCDKCQAVWLPVVGPTGKPGSGYQAYRTSHKMICPQCDSMAATFFRTGKLSHTCPGCGGNMTRCTAQIVSQQSSSGRSTR